MRAPIRHYFSLYVLPFPSHCLPCYTLLFIIAVTSIFETDQAYASKSAPVISQPLLPYGFTADTFINWIFNVSDPKPLYCLVDAAFNDRSIEALGIEPTTFLSDINNLITIIPAFLRCYTVGANI